jgi:hypothetical protein
VSVRRLRKTRYLSAVAVVTAATVGAAPAAQTAPGCYDRATRPFTSVVDSHVHFRPFGGKAIPFAEMARYLQRAGVQYANVYGIGQMLPTDSTCTYYLDCPGTPVEPTMKNDFANAEHYLATQPPGVKLTLSMTFPDLADPDGVVDKIHLLDKEYPGLFHWMGEVNLIKQALLPNHAEPATEQDIADWAPFMKILRERGIPLTIHSDLGNQDEPVKYLDLMRDVLKRYPDNKIVWAHMGLSKELPHMDPDRHIRILTGMLDEHPNLTLDISWRVLHDLYFSHPGIRAEYVAFFNAHPTRVLPGTDFVASRKKDYGVYKEELRVTGLINQHLDDEAFRDIALGQNYFRLLGLDAVAPAVCKA